MPRSAPVEPCGRGSTVAAMREAVVAVWDRAALADVRRRLGGACRQAFEGLLLADDWIPEREIVAFYEAVHTGPAAQRPAIYRRWVDTVMDRGFGRVRRLLLSMANPRLVVTKATELWQHDHTHGTLSAVVDGDVIHAKLADWPPLANRTARETISEAFRYAVVLSSAKGAIETHELDANGALDVTIRFW